MPRMIPYCCCTTHPRGAGQGEQKEEQKIEIKKTKENKETRILRNILELTIISCFMCNGNLLVPILQID
jgi:hypothetical protein